MASVLVVLAAATAISVAVVARTNSARSTGSPLPAALEEKGFSGPAEPPDGYISLDQALRAVELEFGNEIKGEHVEPFLVRVTDASTLGSSKPITDRPAWVLWYSGLHIPVSGPAKPNGVPSDGGTLTWAVVLVDASTGEWVSSQYGE